MNPADVTFILPIDGYYQLIDADGFTDISEVGPGLAGKLTGQVGTVFGSPVIVTDQMADVLRTSGSSGVSKTAALAVNSANYIIPRLRGVTFETDYQVQQQRNLIVAHQSLGFQNWKQAQVHIFLRFVQFTTKTCNTTYEGFAPHKFLLMDL